MSEHKRIMPEELEVGMSVAYPYEVVCGWGRNFRYRIWREYRVKRITPKRTKVVLEGKGSASGIEVDLKRYKVYEPDAAMSRENEIVSVYKDSVRTLNDYVSRKWRDLYSLSDDELKEVHGHLMALDAILNKEKRREENG